MYPENAGGVRFGDVANILDNYRDMKIGDFTEQDIKNGNLISFFASASTWQYLKAASNYISCGEVRTFSDKQTFNWPNFESFFTTHGLSMRTSSAYNHNEQWSFPFGVEHVFRGEHVTEYSVGTKYRFEQIPLKLSANLFAGLSPGTNIELEYSYWEKTLIHTGISVDNLNSLNGERHIVSLKDGEIASSLYIGLTRTL